MLQHQSPLLLNGGNEQPRVLGNSVPRLWTPPLRELTPETSLGYDVIEFARDDLGAPLDPWQEWTVIHGFELLPDGRMRFRKLLILVARQNGKTHLCCVLSLYWMYVQRVPQILGTSTKLEYAKDAWEKAKEMAQAVPELDAEISHRGAIKTVNGGVVLWRADDEERSKGYRGPKGSKYKIAPANEQGGRSQTNDRVLLDELRHHYDYSAWDASVPTTNAVYDAMVVGLSNAGSDRSVVLNDYRAAAIKFIETGVGDPRAGLIEYSSPVDAKPTDVNALAQANPNLNIRIDQETLLGEAIVAMEKGGKKLAGFKTEYMCIHVPQSDPAVDLEKWRDCKNIGTLSQYRDRIALCFDVSIDGSHATLVAAAMMADGRVRIEVVAVWDGPDEMVRFEREFRAHVTKVKAKALGWFPSGPSAAHGATVLGAEMNEETGVFEVVGGRPKWMPASTKLISITDQPGVCMGFSSQVQLLKVVHSDDPVLNEHVPGADKLHVGDRWRAARRASSESDAESPVDGYYASAGAVHLARIVPPPVGKPRLVTARQ